MVTDSALVPAGDSPAAIMERVIIAGDLAKLTPEERVTYYMRVCESIGLNPLTRPFDYITLNGKLTLYPNKDCAAQLRRIQSISVTDLRKELIGDIFTVTVFGRDGDRDDVATGAVAIKGLFGEALANAYMKAETKAKRRLSLSLAGLGFADESEVEDIPAEQPEGSKPMSLSERVAARKATLAPETPAETVEGEVVAETVAPATEAVPAPCDDEDASPMALGHCAKLKGHPGSHSSENGTWPR